MFACFQTSNSQLTQVTGTRGSVGPARKSVFLLVRLNLIRQSTTRMRRSWGNLRPIDKFSDLKILI